MPKPLTRQQREESRYGPDDYGEYDGEPCRDCDGRGFIVICIDDLCRNSDECIHGDGMIACPTCEGNG